MRPLVSLDRSTRFSTWSTVSYECFSSALFHVGGALRNTYEKSRHCVSMDEPKWGQKRIRIRTRWLPRYLPLHGVSQESQVAYTRMVLWKRNLSQTRISVDEKRIRPEVKRWNLLLKRLTNKNLWKFKAMGVPTWSFPPSLRASNCPCYCQSSRVTLATARIWIWWIHIEKWDRDKERDAILPPRMQVI